MEHSNSNPVTTITTVTTGYIYDGSDCEGLIAKPPLSGSLVTPLDTPPDWHDRIARRQREWRDLGPEQALRTWHARGEASRHVLAAMGVTL